LFVVNLNVIWVLLLAPTTVLGIDRQVTKDIVSSCYDVNGYSICGVWFKDLGSMWKCIVRYRLQLFYSTRLKNMPTHLTPDQNYRACSCLSGSFLSELHASDRVLHLYHAACPNHPPPIAMPTTFLSTFACCLLINCWSSASLKLRNAVWYSNIEHNLEWESFEFI